MHAVHFQSLSKWTFIAQTSDYGTEKEIYAAHLYHNY